MIDLMPTKCNICGGKVIFSSNSVIYHREYGSGKCYRCLSCGAYVGTHRPRPREAFGLLADDEMRKGKIICHEIFDSMWKGKRNSKRKRTAMYAWLAEMLGITVNECHFGYFDKAMLDRAQHILTELKEQELEYDSEGRILNMLDYTEMRKAG